MERSSVWAVVVLLSVAAASMADDVNPPAYRGLDAATLQSWEFVTAGYISGSHGHYVEPDGLSDNPHGYADLNVRRLDGGDLSVRYDASADAWGGGGLEMGLSVPLGEMYYEIGGVFGGADGDGADGFYPQARVQITYASDVVPLTTAPIIETPAPLDPLAETPWPTVTARSYEVVSLSDTRAVLVQDFSISLTTYDMTGAYNAYLTLDVLTPDAWGDEGAGLGGQIESIVVDTYAYQAPAGEPWDPSCGPLTIESFVILKNNFGQTVGGGWTEGDFDGDGVVNIDDFVVLKNCFGVHGCSVPEPATLTLLLVGAATLRRRRA